ncbi:hypothetical protein CANARDRAFT_23075 [[Candida] arabinofermentans NRRL YB-2248]|uniref:Stress response protein NST1 n=1 Tax=[Candida] arabinofermentans NRRL YB-2248 TaxID=983967 RepID=A0A1E4T1B2_9ASCO|nr:hypothetical protein CANARDRAFT_23075 [[Candida] arabinofermentans NRRL YB-2248]
MSTNSAPGDHSHSEFIGRSSLTVQPKSKKNKKKKTKHSDKKVQVQLNDASAEYPTSRVIKQGANGDVIVTELLEDDHDHHRLHHHHHHHNQEHGHSHEAYDEDDYDEVEDAYERWEQHHQCEHGGDDHSVQITEEEEYDHFCPHHHHHHGDEEEEEEDEDDEDEDEDENNYHHHNHNHNHHSHNHHRLSNEESLHRQQQIIQRQSTNPVFGNYLWNSNTSPEEKERIKQFWVSLDDERKRSIIQISKGEVLKVIREEQKVSCNCKICGNRKVTLEKELEKLYYGYYNVRRLASGATDELQVNKSLIDSLLGISHQQASQHQNNSDDVHSEKQFSLATSPNDVKSVAEDILKNDGKRFIDMVEQLDSERNGRHQNQNSPEFSSNQINSDDLDHENYQNESHHEHGKKHGDFEFEDEEREECDDEDYDDEEDENDEEEYVDDDEAEDTNDDEDGDEGDYDEEEENDTERRLEETYKMLQLITSKILRTKLLAAYKEKVAEDSTKRLIEELEAEERRKKEKEEKEKRKKEKLKEKKRLLQLAKEEEKKRKIDEKLEQERLMRDEQVRKTEEGRKRKEAERKKKEEEAKKKKDEKKKRKEAEQERLRKEKEEKDQRLLEERLKRQEEMKRKEEEKRKLEQEKSERLQREKETKNNEISQGPNETSSFEIQSQSNFAENPLLRQTLSSMPSMQASSLQQSLADDHLNPFLLNYNNTTGSTISNGSHSVIQPPPGYLPSASGMAPSSLNNGGYNYIDIPLAGMDLSLPPVNPTTSSPWGNHSTQLGNGYGGGLRKENAQSNTPSVFASPFLHSQGQLNQPESQAQHHELPTSSQAQQQQQQQQVSQLQIPNAQVQDDIHLLTQYMNSSHLSDETFGLQKQPAQQPVMQSQPQHPQPHLPQNNGFTAPNAGNLVGPSSTLGGFHSSRQSSLLSNSSFFGNNDLTSNVGGLTTDAGVWGSSNGKPSETASNSTGLNESIWGLASTIGTTTPQVTAPISSLWNNTSNATTNGTSNTTLKSNIIGSNHSSISAPGGSSGDQVLGSTSLNFNQLTVQDNEMIQLEAFKVSSKLPSENGLYYSAQLLYHYTRQALPAMFSNLKIEQFINALTFPLVNKVGISYEVVFDDLRNAIYVKVLLNNTQQPRQLHSRPSLPQLNSLPNQTNSTGMGVNAQFNSSLLGGNLGIGLPASSPFGDGLVDKGLLDTWGTGFR